jgi:hypothetical protein
MSTTDGILMEIILAIVHKAGGKLVLERADVDFAHERFIKGDFVYGPQPDGTFLLEFKDPT